MASMFDRYINERQQEKSIVKAVGESNKVASMFNSDKVGSSGSQDPLTRLVSQVYVKLVKPDKEGLQPDNLSKEKIKNFSGR